jgi:hypothetical protein
MTDSYSKVHGKEEIYFDEDKRMKAIEELEDPKEIDAALEILDEKIGETLKDEDTSPSESETPDEELSPEEKKEKEGEDTSGKQKEKDDKEQGEIKKDDAKDDLHQKIADKLEGKESGKAGDKFLLTEDVINSQPEADRKILINYKDKDKAELAKSAANAIAVKSPYLKDNEEAISLLAKQLESKPEAELLKTLVDVQREAGKAEPAQEKEQIVEDIELPDLTDSDPKIKVILETETLKRLKASYPNMPDVTSMDSEEYKEWRRDQNVDNPDNTFKDDLESTREDVKTELSKIVFIQNNLPNLFEESPIEVLPMLTPENLPRLKALNDNPMELLVNDINTEIVTIKKGLEKYGLTEKDLNIDLTITKDADGYPYNETLNSLVSEGLTSDGKPIPSPKIIGQRGNVFWLKQGELAKKFKDEYDDKILTAFVNKKTQTDKKVKEKLKEETLIAGTGKTKSGSGKTITLEDIEKEQNPAVIDKMIAQLEKV